MAGNEGATQKTFKLDSVQQAAVEDMAGQMTARLKNIKGANVDLAKQAASLAIRGFEAESEKLSQTGKTDIKPDQAVDNQETRDRVKAFTDAYVQKQMQQPGKGKSADASGSQWVAPVAAKEVTPDGVPPRRA